MKTKYDWDRTGLGIAEPDELPLRPGRSSGWTKPTSGSYRCRLWIQQHSDGFRFRMRDCLEAGFTRHQYTDALRRLKRAGHVRSTSAQRHVLCY